MFVFYASDDYARGAMDVSTVRIIAAGKEAVG
jgi:hypothetical protein